jgi:hypothetical protein
MSDNVVFLNIETRLPVPIGRVLDGAREQLVDGIVIGTDHDGRLYVAASTGDAGELLILLELAKGIILGHAKASRA